MTDYTFFTHPMSRGQIVRWALHEVEADYEQVLVDWTAKPEALLEANPMGKVPTLIHHAEEDDRVITEAAAICAYLAETEANGQLAPNDEERADYLRYFFFAASSVEYAIVANTMGWKAEDPQKQGMVGFGSFERAMATFETMLADRDYVCGGRFTMADVYVGSQVDWGLTFGTIPPEEAFVAYAERMQARAAYKQAKAIDGALIEKAKGND